MKKCSQFLLLSLCLLPSFAQAVDLEKSLQIHGFASQGYLYSSDNNFLAQSASGSYEFTDLGLNLNWAIFDRLRAGGQIFYRNLGDYSEDKPVIDWALLDYQPVNWAGIRLGKIKMPHGLYNENRDNDFLQPTIFLPQSIYDESRRDTALAYTGAGLYGNLQTGPWGDIDYHFFSGETSYPEDSILAQSTKNSILENIARNNSRRTSNPALYNPLIPDTFLSQERENEKLYGGAMVFNSSLTDLRLGLTVLHSENAVYVNGQSTPLIESTVHSKFVISLEYVWQDWLFVTEYGESDRTTTFAGLETMNGPSQSWYAMICYSPFEKWTFSALYDEFYRLKNDKDGETRPQVEPYMGWRKDSGLAVRYDINDHLNIKAEYHYIDGGGLQLGILNPEGVDRYWDYIAAKLSYNF